MSLGDIVNALPIVEPNKQTQVATSKKAERKVKVNPPLETTEALISGFEESMANMKALQWKLVEPNEYQAACEFTLLLDKIQTEFKTQESSGEKMQFKVPP